MVGWDDIVDVEKESVALGEMLRSDVLLKRERFHLIPLIVHECAAVISLFCCVPQYTLLRRRNRNRSCNMNADCLSKTGLNESSFSLL